jgi:hypothetical protein
MLEDSHRTATRSCGPGRQYCHATQAQGSVSRCAAAVVGDRSWWATSVHVVCC